MTFPPDRRRYRCSASISVNHELIQGTVDYSVQHQVPVVTNNEGLIIENLNAQDWRGVETISFALSGLCHFPFFTHGLRRGLHSFAASRLPALEPLRRR